MPITETAEIAIRPLSKPGTQKTHPIKIVLHAIFLENRTETYRVVTYKDATIFAENGIERDKGKSISA